MVKQKSLDRVYPINVVPFEAFYNGSWHGVNQVNIKNGYFTVQVNYYGSVIEDAISSDYIRLRSRKACEFDCLHILKTGVDVCVLSTYPIAEGPGVELQEPMLSWLDAKIISIRKDHQEGRCACRFSVILYKNKAPTSCVTSASDRVTTEMVSIDRIAILQKLHSEPCEDGFHHWNSTEDCITSKRSKLPTGSVSSEIAWLVVFSILKGMHFNIRLIQTRIVYHILNYVEVSSKVAVLCSESDNEGTSTNLENTIRVLSFRKGNETMQTKIETLFHKVFEETTAPEATTEKGTSYQMLNDESDVEVLYDYSSLRRSKRRKILPERFTSYTEPNFNRCSYKKPSSDSDEFEESTAIVARLLLQEGPYMMDLQQSVLGERNSEGIIKFLPAAQEVACSGQEVKHDRHHRSSTLLHEKNLSDGNTAEPLPGSAAIVVLDSSDSELSLTSSSTDIEEISGSDSDFTEINPLVRSKRDSSGSRTKTSRETPFSFKTHHRFSRPDATKYKNGKTLLSVLECKKLIEKYMGNTESERGSHCRADSEGAPSPDAKFLDKFADFNWSPHAETETEADEHEELWKEMEDSLATLALFEQKQKLDIQLFGETTYMSDEDSEERCRHDYKLDEQIGLVCQLCNFVCTEIRDIAQNIYQNGLFTTKEKWDIDDIRLMGLYNLELDPLGNLLTEACDSVWTPISDLRGKLHLHQKRAFEFIWRNIAGSLHPDKMNEEMDNTGGCVISHSPGSGKTLLVISFLASYLRLFPLCRPLILAPKTAVYVWWKEFEKWGVSIPVHLIHPFESYKKEVWDPKYKYSSTSGRRPNVKMMHVIDCLSKLKQWRESPGVLLMSYPAFFAFTFKESKMEYRRFMADILHNSPGLLILDEGHNPRSTRSKLRKQLLKVNTRLRILLSGTLFQNNFEEYFNTLSLARPRFVEEVISELDPRTLNISKAGRKSSRKERLARKLFVEEIGQRIESVKEEERKRGFCLLNRVTNRFIDIHDGERPDDLPGLHVYTVMLTSTDIQKEILTKLQNSITQKRCPLELELLITVGSIHPWLIKTVVCVDDFFNAEELEKVERYKKHFTSGSKVKFVIDIVHKSNISGERVLVFCHNIAPINFLVELFENVFGWSKGEEVLVLQGDQELFERARIMDQFNIDPKNKCKVLLASTLACAEGISLTAASRVILLDSEWNHSKTRQAIARAFRPGQKKMVYVYRLLALGTWEEDKYHSNEWKAWLSKMIFIGRYIKFEYSKQVEDPEDEMLKEVLEEDQGKTIQIIMKQE